MPPDRNSTPNDLRNGLHARFHGPLMTFFQRRVNDRVQAEDLTQEVLTRVVNAAAHTRIDQPESFVFKIAINLLRDRKRRSLRDGDPDFVPIDEALATEFEAQLIEELTPERVLISRDTLKDVLESLAALSQRTHDIFVLFKLENMPQQDIAAIFGISRSAVQKHVLRATLHLGVKYGRQ